MALTPGTRLGPYVVEAPIGAGGMGEVYRARDSKLGRDVALKILPEAFAADPDRVARFRREAQVLAALNHQHIAHIHGFEDAGSTPALVMEFVEGPTLAERLAAGPIEIDDAIPIAKQIAEALEAAHEQGIVHRDLKPANVKVKDDGTVKVLDFGLAKALDPGGGSTPDAMHSPTLTARATELGVILGTAAYMSPEQAKGKTVDKRTDIWAFGCVFYEMLTGERAFKGEDVSDTLASVLRQEVDLAALPRSTPPPIARLIARCLERDAKKRLRDIGEARILLEDPASARPVAPVQHAPSPAPGRARVWRTATAWLVSGILIGAGIGAALFLRAPALSQVLKYRLSAREYMPIVARHIVTISPDGMNVVYATNNRLYLQRLSEFEARPIQGTEIFDRAEAPAFSPDGQSIAFFAASDLTIKRIAVTGGAASTICPVQNPFGLSWTPQGILYAERRNLMRVSDRGGTPEKLFTCSDKEIVQGPRLLPDGEHVLFAIATEDATDRWDKARIIVRSLKSGEQKTILEGGSDPWYVPTGHLVYVWQGVMLGVGFDLRTLTVTSRSVPVVEGVRRAPDGTSGVANFGAADNGTIVYVPGPVTQSGAQLGIGISDRSGKVEALKIAPGPYKFVRMSPDGTRLVFETDDGKDPVIWTYEVSGASGMKRLTFTGKNHYPTWTADGKQVVFQSDREGDLGLWKQSVDLTGKPERLTRAAPGESHAPESWSPTNDALLFTVSKGLSVALWTLSLKDGKTAPFGDVHSVYPTGAVFRRDGKWVAYSTTDVVGGRIMLYVQPFPPTGAIYTVVSSGYFSPHHPLWSPDGKELYYNPRAGGFEAVSVTTEPTFAFGNPVAVARPIQMGAPGVRRPVDITPDGRFVGLIEPGRSEAQTLPTELAVIVNWYEDLKARLPARQ